MYPSVAAVVSLTFAFVLSAQAQDRPPTLMVEGTGGVAIAHSAFAETRAGTRNQAELTEASAFVFEGTVLAVETLAEWQRDFPIRATIEKTLKPHASQRPLPNGMTRTELRECPFSYAHPGKFTVPEGEINKPAMGQKGTFYLDAYKGEFRLIGYIRKSDANPGVVPADGELKVVRPQVPKGWTFEMATSPALAVFRQFGEIPADWQILGPLPPRQPGKGEAGAATAPEAPVPRDCRSVERWLKETDAALANTGKHMVVAVSKTDPAGRIRIEKIAVSNGVLRVDYSDTPSEGAPPDKSGDLVVCQRADLPAVFVENGTQVCMPVPVEIQNVAGSIGTEAIGISYVSGIHRVANTNDLPVKALLRAKPCQVRSSVSALRRHGTEEGTRTVWQARMEDPIGPDTVIAGPMYGVCNVHNVDRSKVVSVDVRSGAVIRHSAPVGKNGAAKVVVEWATAFLAGKSAETAALSDVPFTWDGKQVIEKSDELQAMIRKTVANKGIRDFTPGEPIVETGAAAAAILKGNYLGKEEGIVVVRVPVKTESVTAFIRPGQSPKVVGFRD